RNSCRIRRRQLRKRRLREHACQCRNDQRPHNAYLRRIPYTIPARTRTLVQEGLFRSRSSTAARASRSRRCFSAARSLLVPHTPQVTGSFGRGFAVAALKRVPPHCGHLSVNLICVIAVGVVSQVVSSTLMKSRERRGARGPRKRAARSGV